MGRLFATIIAATLILTCLTNSNWAACPDKVENHRFITSGPDIVQRLEDGSIRKVGTNHIFSLYGLFDLKRYRLGRLSYPQHNNILIRGPISDMSYELRTEPAFVGGDIAEENVAYTLHLNMTLTEHPPADHLDPQDSITAMGEAVSRATSRGSLSETFMWPNSYEDAALKNGVHAVYTMTFGPIYEMDSNACKFRVRDVGLIDTLGHKTTVQLLIDWRITLSALKQPVLLTPNAKVDLKYWIY